MSIKELQNLAQSPEAPYMHAEYTVWLHDRIVEVIQHDLDLFRNDEAFIIRSVHTACEKISKFPSLKKVQPCK